MLNFLKPELKKDIKIVANTILYIFLILALIYIVFGLPFTIKSNKMNSKKIYTYDNISTAINEKRQLVVFYNDDGTYQVFSDTVTQGIFNQVASLIKCDYNNKVEKK